MATLPIRQPLLTPNPTSTDFTYFKREFANFCQIIQLDDSLKLQMLQNCLGRDGIDILDGLPAPKDKFEEALKRLEEHFGTASSLLLKRRKFYMAKQEQNEPATMFAVRLRRLAQECDFSDPSFLLRDMFVMNIHNDALGERLRSEDATTLTFGAAVNKAETFERARNERNTIASSMTIPI